MACVALTGGGSEHSCNITLSLCGSSVKQWEMSLKRLYIAISHCYQCSSARKRDEALQNCRESIEVFRYEEKDEKFTRFVI